MVLLLHTFDRMILHRMNFVPISGAHIHSQSSDAFVDDTSVGFTSSDATSFTDLIACLEEAAQTWEKLLSLSGGKLKLTKCSWYFLQWEWMNGRPVIRRLQQDPTIALTQGESSTTTIIKRHCLEHIKGHCLEHSSRVLGVYLNPMGDFSDHL